MARQAQAQARNTYNTAKDLTAGSEANAGSLYNQLNPFYSGEMTNPQGLGPTELAAANTANQQSLGGAEGGAIEQGNLEAARTRNSAGVTSAEDDAARNAMKTDSENSIGINLENAKLKRQQQQQGAAGEKSLYDTNNADVLASLGLQNESTNTGIKAGQSGWFQNMLGLISALKPSGSYTPGSGGNIGIG